MVGPNIAPLDAGPLRRKQSAPMVFETLAAPFGNLANRQKIMSTPEEIEAGEVADEQIASWRARGFTPELAWQALSGTRYRNNARWRDVRAYMIRWWLRNSDAA